MGYLSNMFLEIANLSQADSVLDVGAQDVAVSSEQELKELNQFIALKKSNEVISMPGSFPVIFEAKEIYERAGYRYTNIDVDERPGTIRVDLATFKIPRNVGKFPIVVNVGTTEHLASPVACFALMHELCLTGGIIYNDVPMFGFGNHGLLNATAKFWHALIWMNQYKPLLTKVRAFDESIVDRGNFYHDYLNYFEGLSDVKNISYLMRCVVQKTKETIFVPPFDAIFPDSADGKSLAKLLAGSYFPFLKTGTYTKAEVRHGINQFLELNSRSYRMERVFSKVYRLSRILAKKMLLAYKWQS